MSIIAEINLEGTTLAQYDNVRTVVGHILDPPEGLLVHTTHMGETTLYNIDAWEDEDALNKFATNRLSKAMAEVGLHVEPDIKIYQAHEVFVPLRILTGSAMLLCVHVAPVTDNEYDLIREEVGWIDQPDPEGLAHMSWFEGDVSRNIDAWVSTEAFEGFALNRLAPAFERIGRGDLTPTVDSYPAHEIFAPKPVVSL